MTDEEGNLLALKLHRLGRTSFRNVKQKRDYLRSLTASYNWLHLSKLSALKEFAFMRALGEHGFPVPRAGELNRHAVLMSLVPATPLTQVRELANPHVVWRQAADIMVKLAQHGASSASCSAYRHLLFARRTETVCADARALDCNRAGALRLQRVQPAGG